MDQLQELFVCITHVENGMHLEDRGGGVGGGGPSLEILV